MFAAVIRALCRMRGWFMIYYRTRFNLRNSRVALITAIKMKAKYKPHAFMFYFTPHGTLSAQMLRIFPRPTTEHHLRTASLVCHKFASPTYLYYCLWAVINMAFECPLVEQYSYHVSWKSVTRFKSWHSGIHARARTHTLLSFVCRSEVK
jgi:hypothetical protein